MKDFEIYEIPITGRALIHTIDIEYINCNVLFCRSKEKKRIATIGQEMMGKIMNLALLILCQGK
jgi:hypothetical protein